MVLFERNLHGQHPLAGQLLGKFAGGVTKARRETVLGWESLHAQKQLHLFLSIDVDLKMGWQDWKLIEV